MTERPAIPARLTGSYRPPLQAIDYALLPEHLRSGMQRYLEDGMLPGGFLQAVLKNDLAESFARADLESQAAMFDIVVWLNTECPGTAWGNEEKVKAWTLERGAEGENVGDASSLSRGASDG